MTQSDIPANTPTPVAAEAAVQAVLADPSRLGLTWDLRPGTVQSPTPPTVVLDGDTAGIVVTSMIGPVAQGDRVYVLEIPPSGNFIVGATATPTASLAGNTIGSAYFSGGTTAGSTGAEAALGAWTSSSPFVIAGNRVVQLTLTTGYLTNSAAVSAQVILVRKVVGSTVATALLSAQPAIPAGLAGTVLSLTSVSYVKNTSSGPITFNPGVSNVRSVGAGTNSIFGDANITMSLTGKDIGSTFDLNLAGILGLAVTIT